MFCSRNFFERYRNLDENASKPERFSDCARMFNDCKDAEKYNHVEDDDGDDAENDSEQKDETTTESVIADKKSHSDEADEKEGAGDAPDEHSTTESNISNFVRRKRTHKPLSSFRMHRKISIL